MSNDVNKCRCCYLKNLFILYSYITDLICNKLILINNIKLIYKLLNDNSKEEMTFYKLIDNVIKLKQEKELLNDEEYLKQQKIINKYEKNIYDYYGYSCNNINKVNQYLIFFKYDDIIFYNCINNISNEIKYIIDSKIIDKNNISYYDQTILFFQEYIWKKIEKKT